MSELPPGSYCKVCAADLRDKPAVHVGTGGLSRKELLFMKRNYLKNERREANERALKYIWNSFLFSTFVTLTVLAFLYGG